jgi:hypothetical protein
MLCACGARRPGVALIAVIKAVITLDYGLHKPLIQRRYSLQLTTVSGL